MPPKKTHCPKNHEYTDDNTYTDARGYRHCKTCRRDRMRRRRNFTGEGAGAKNAAKTHCPKGHEYTEENTYWMPSKTSKSGYARACRECNRINLSKQNVRRYGLTPKELADRVALQDNRCAICKTEFSSTRKRHIDHDHSCCSPGGSCGACVRGILCASCNHGLGNFKDSPELLRAALTYLEKVSPVGSNHT